MKLKIFALASISLLSISFYSRSEAFVPLGVPVVMALEGAAVSAEVVAGTSSLVSVVAPAVAAGTTASRALAIASGTSASAFSMSGLYTYAKALWAYPIGPTLNALGNVAGIVNAVNAINFWVKGSSSGNPDFTVQVDPNGVPSDLPNDVAWDRKNKVAMTTSVFNSSNSPKWTLTQGSCGGGSSTVTGATVAAIAIQSVEIPQCYGNEYRVSTVNEETGVFCTEVYDSFTGQHKPGSGYCLTATALPPQEGSTPPTLVQLPSNKTCNILRNGNRFFADPNDPDCSAVGFPTGLSLTDDTLTYSNGSGSTVVMKINTDGTTTITSREPNETRTATTENVVKLSSPSADGTGDVQVVGAKTNVYSGTGSETSTNPISSTTAVDSKGNSTSNTNSGTSTSNQDTSQIKTDVDTIKKDLEKLTDDTPVSTPVLPEVPKLYTPTYKDGFSAVWDKHILSLKQTSLFGLLSTLMPNIPTGGECPSITLDLNVGWFNGGSADLSPDCNWWLFARAFVMISAALACRRLIFGG